MAAPGSSPQGQPADHHALTDWANWYEDGPGWSLVFTDQGRILLANRSVRQGLAQSIQTLQTLSVQEIDVQLGGQGLIEAWFAQVPADRQSLTLSGTIPNKGEGALHVEWQFARVVHEGRRSVCLAVGVINTAAMTMPDGIGWRPLPSRSRLVPPESSPVEAAVAAEGFDAALQAALAELCATGDWVLGEAWLPHWDDWTIRCSVAWYGRLTDADRFRVASESLAFPIGQGLPGRVWETLQPEWLADVSMVPTSDFWRSQVAADCGLKGAIALPVPVRPTRSAQHPSNLLAVLVIFTTERREFEPWVVEGLASAAAQLGPILQHKRDEARYRSLYENAVEGIFQLAPSGYFLQVNPAFAAILGYDSPQAALRSLNGPQAQFYASPQDEQAFFSALNSADSLQSFECEVYRRDGQRIWLEQRARCVRDSQGRILCYEGCALDVTARKWTEAQLKYNSVHDVLTGLRNRAWFMERLVQAVSAYQNDPRGGFALLFLDIDDFNRINNSLGHWMGDRLLIALTDRLDRAIGPERSMARVGGDEFAILVEPASEAQMAIAIAEQIETALADPFWLDDREIFLQASIGIVYHTGAIKQADPVHPQRVMRDVDLALQQAKKGQTCRWVMFEESMLTNFEQQLQLETDLRWAIARDEFEVYFQPIIGLESGQLGGFEALVRWQHPDRGVVSPAEFINLAEEWGMIGEIGQHVLRSVAQQWSQWRAEFPIVDQLTVNVNLSAKQLTPDLVSRVQSVLVAAGLPGKCLKLELTETSLAIDSPQVRQDLQRLRSMGIGICLDDFGTGYCSLKYLHEFPIDALKIDRSFVQCLFDPTPSAAIVATIVSLGRSMGLTIVAEGIETWEQANHLKSLGCQYGQGFLFARPLSVEQVTAVLARGGQLNP